MNTKKEKKNLGQNWSFLTNDIASACFAISRSPLAGSPVIIDQSTILADKRMQKCPMIPCQRFFVTFIEESLRWFSNLLLISSNIDPIPTTEKNDTVDARFKELFRHPQKVP